MDRWQIDERFSTVDDAYTAHGVPVPTELLHRNLTYYLRGIGFQIHTALGGGHREEEYENALAYALEDDGVPFMRQSVYDVQYCGRQVGQYRPDLMLADGKVLVELKAAPRIEALHKAQTLSYLRVTGAELGLVMNFGGSSMQFERLPNYLMNRASTHRPVASVDDLLYPVLTRSVLDAVFAVHQQLGPGFLQQIYRRSTRIEMGERGLAVEYLRELPLRFRDAVIATKPTRLFHVEGKLLVATLATKNILPVHSEKLRWAMRSVSCRLGLIANFYPSTLDVRFYRHAA